MYVRSLQAFNLRCFREAELNLQFPGREPGQGPLFSNVNLLLGINGSGKTTILKAIALGILGETLEGAGFVPYRLVRREPTQEEGESRIAVLRSRLVLHAQDLPRENTEELARDIGIARIRDQERLHPYPKVGSPEQNQLRSEVNEELFDDSSPAFFLVGYGATRYVVGATSYESLPNQRKRRSLRYQRVAGLFEDYLGLSPLIAWFPRITAENPRRAQEIGDLLNELLPAEARFMGQVTEDDEYIFEHCGVPVPLGALSDGYRAYIGWVSDLLYNLSHSVPAEVSLRDARGVVLVDEIDLHLHPEWQREVVPVVARTLPNLQFVFTTHSPIVAGTLNAKNIFVLEMDGQGASTIRQLEEPIHGLNADQILLSSYFNLDTTRAPEAVDELRDLSRRAMGGDSKAALTFLEKITGGTEPSPPPRKAGKTSRRSRAKTR